MAQEPDYKAAYEILEKALQNADRILRQAHLRAALRLDRERNLRKPEFSPHGGGDAGR